MHYIKLLETFQELMVWNCVNGFNLGGVNLTSVFLEGLCSSEYSMHLSKSWLENRAKNKKYKEYIRLYPMLLNYISSEINLSDQNVSHRDLQYDIFVSCSTDHDQIQ
jgi:hypothetical protein